jgi:ubiquinone/menaquinone biosynthesis C-methylase UbiE
VFLFLTISIILLLSALLYWLLVTTEGAFLGRRTVVWLYDITAHRYDKIKQFDPGDERHFIAAPLNRALEEINRPLLLDIATGSGRVPVDLINEPNFNGLIIGLDPAKKMLAQARHKLASVGANSDQVVLVQGTADPLPFAGSLFNAVTCLESLEFFPSAKTALIGMLRVMKPGAFLMTSRRRGFNGRLFLNRYHSVKDLEAMLAEIGFEKIETRLWELDYDMVTAHKPLN